jgi:hypothetical protein
MKCEVCNANVNELRRGRCWGCYNRWVDARPVGLGAQCAVCAERRRDLLRGLELLGSWMPMCYACSGQAMRLEPLPQTLAGIRRALIRERRERERRFGKKDTRVFQYDRRHDDRRLPREGDDSDWVFIDDDMIVEVGDAKAQSAGSFADADKVDREDEELTRILDTIRVD